MVPWALEQNVRFKPNIGPLLNPLDVPGKVDQKLIDDLPDKLAPVKAINLQKQIYHQKRLSSSCRCAMDNYDLYG